VKKVTKEDSSPSGRISRRAFVAGSLVAGTGVAVLGYSGIGIARDDRRPEFDTSSPTGDLQEAEMVTIEALVQVLVPERIGVGPTRVRQIVGEATRTRPGVLREYRDGVRLLDQLAGEFRGRPFSEISLVERDGILDRILWRYPAESGDLVDDVVSKTKRRLERVWHDDQRRRFRQLVVRDLLTQTYAAAIPTLIGYSNLPGVPGDARAYVSPPSD